MHTVLANFIAIFKDIIYSFTLHASQLVLIIISTIESQVLHVEKRPLLKESPSTSRNDSEEEEVIEVESEEEVEVMPEEVIGVHVVSEEVTEVESEQVTEAESDEEIVVESDEEMEVESAEETEAGGDGGVAFSRSVIVE